MEREGCCCWLRRARFRTARLTLPDGARARQGGCVRLLRHLCGATRSAIPPTCAAREAKVGGMEDEGRGRRKVLIGKFKAKEAGPARRRHPRLAGWLTLDGRGQDGDNHRLAGHEQHPANSRKPQTRTICHFQKKKSPCNPTCVPLDRSPALHPLHCGVVGRLDVNAPRGILQRTLH